jgi:signal transduction histidine kinase/DNA-binding response OmpR family regulator/ligand-binding sensor domain-containing protein
MVVQLLSASILELSIQHWTQNNGLPPYAVQSIEQDEQGLILLNCQEGTFQFNGYNYIRTQLKEDASSNVDIQLRENNLISGTDTLLKNCTGFYHSQGEYWITSERGIGQLDAFTKKINWLNKTGDLPEQNCFHPTKAPDGKIWFSIGFSGIAFYEPTSGQFYSIQNINEYTGFTQAHNVFATVLDRNINHLFFDQSSNLWIATQNDGLYKVTFKPQRFQYFRSEYETNGGLAHRDISFPLTLKDGNVWIATWGGGINIWKKKDQALAHPDFQNIPVKQLDGSSLAEKKVFPMIEDSRSNIWFGTFGAGLYYMSASRKQQKDYRSKVFSRRRGQIPNDVINGLCEGANNDIWCGTNSGLVHIDAKLKSRYTFPELEQPDLFAGKNIRMLSLTNNKNLWIGCNDGTTYLWNLTSNNIKVFSQAEGSPMGILLNVQEHQGVDWFAGSEGLFYYHYRLNKFLRFKNNHLLPSRHLESILKDDHGNLWLGSSQGIIKVNPESAQVKAFDLYTGRQGNSCTQGASKDSSGYLYFGSRYGFYRFHPDILEQETPENPIFINNISINGENHSLKSLKQSEQWAEEDKFNGLELNHQQNAISINFNSLNYNREEVINYLVVLEGYDKEWISTSDRQRHFSSLQPGNYHLKIKEQGRDSIYGLSFRIKPPWWTTSYAIAGYAVAGFIFLYLFSLWISRRSKRLEEQKQKENFDRLRFRFFLNISHEIRTPLTLIKGAIDRLKEIEHSHENKELHRIQHNADRLTRLVNEVLDLKQMEQTGMNAKKSFFNLKAFIDATVDAFRLREEKRHIRLFMPNEPVWINSARELLETILYNLLSNALKFSDDQDEIHIHLDASESECQIKVVDFGIGMDKEEKKHIFERYYQAGRKQKEGSGIGLSLVKELVEILDGRIEVQSVLSKGSTFTVTLPLGKPQQEEETTNLPSKENKKTLLIVDDQADIRSFVKEAFESSYQCLEASNGKEALEVVKMVLPDLIISDVMMPEMNGFELCKQVKEQLETSHIPIILLTAKTGFDAELDAAQCNADAYITKPFREELLKVKVQKLLELREKLQEKYSGQKPEQESADELNPIDQAFINKLNQAIEKELDNPDLKIDHLADTLALSSSGLYRKLKALTGQSPVEYVRILRLNKAAQLLKESSSSVTEIADLTGFGTQKYFSRCFKDHFDISPLKYRNNK